MLKEYKTPYDIQHYGRMVNGFSDAAKGLATAMSQMGIPTEYIRAIVGKGRYNTLEEQGYVIYGPEAAAKAKSNMEGLFGAFYYVHRPELQLSQQAPVLLGKAGCKLQQTLENGKKIEFPLENVKFDFIPRTNRPPYEPGKITAHCDVSVTDSQGKPHILEPGTVLTQKYSGAMVFTEGRPSQTHEWVKDRQGKPVFQIVDAQSKPIEENHAIMMLWGHLGGKGFKALGRNTMEFATLGNDGVDDDVTAERHMVNWLDSVRRNNGIDLMPQFNAFVREAQQSLTAKPALLESFATALELSRLIRDAYQYDNTIFQHSSIDLAGIQYAKEKIQETASMLDLPLPPPSANIMEAFNKTYGSVEEKIAIGKARNELQDRVADLQVIGRLSSAKRHFAIHYSKPGELESALGALEKMSRQMRFPVPQMPGLPEDIASIRSAYQDLEIFFHRPNVQGSSSPAMKQSRKKWAASAPKLKQFLATMDAADCDLQKWVDHYYQEGVKFKSEKAGEISFTQRIAAESTAKDAPRL